METRFRLKRGDDEIELAGSEPWVTAMLEAHLADWLVSSAADITAPRLNVTTHRENNTLSVSPKRSKKNVKASQESPTEDFPRISKDFRPTVNLTVSEFVAMKEATAPADVLITTVYYMEKYLQQETFTAASLKMLLGGVPTWGCADQGSVTEEALTRGHIEQVEPDRYSITYRGQNYVREGLAE